MKFSPVAVLLFLFSLSFVACGGDSTDNTCEQDCSGLECGLDPVCGESCGTCGDYASCGDGLCGCDYLACGEACCAAGESCQDGACAQSLDPCDPNPCTEDHQTQCADDGAGGALCSCDTDYQDYGDGACRPTDPCAGDSTCADQQRECVNDQGVPLCENCLTGYHDESGSCVVNVPCQLDACSEQGDCDDSSGLPVCTCYEGYAGDFCDTCADGYVDFGLGCDLSFRPITAGSFMMGSPDNELARADDELRHSVSFSRSFVMQSSEVTQGRFESLMNYNPSSYSECGEDCPVENVNWYEAAAYGNALSVQEGFATCYVCTGMGVDVICELDGLYATPYDCPGYRLPTESEWEYSARAGTQTATYNGNILDEQHLFCEQPNATLDSIAWFCGNGGEDPFPVATREPNDWGLYDMSGNALEWCHDWFAAYPTSSVEDPWGMSLGTERCIRGGSFLNPAYMARSAERAGVEPDTRLHYLGFRLVRTLPEPP
ncbi:MAG: formylglycine-generating enzyme family protein [Deltaproteobacteria bacterium]|nr:formylglycine-generating enzyme family protein [Deltaproteobacteria bacterium]